jgi:hypothetical protein
MATCPECRGVAEHPASMTSIHSRYQVGDDCCGLIDWYARKSEAVDRARSHRDKHKRENDPREVRVTDNYAPP